MFITRQEYDQLVNEFTDFMRNRFQSCKRDWCLAGVEVSPSFDDPAAYDELIGIAAIVTFRTNRNVVCWYWCEDDADMEFRIDELKDNGHTHIRYVPSFGGYFVYLRSPNVILLK